MRIAITGSTSMIGNALARVALEEGHEVIAIVRTNSEKVDRLPTSDMIKIIECEMSDYGNLQDDERCDIFFHLAWDKTFGRGRDDVDAQVKNMEYSLDAVRLAHRWGASAFIGAGSQAEYGRSDRKLDGNSPTFPTSGYGIAKYATGRMSAIACRDMRMRFCWGRIFSVYGEYDSDQSMIMYLIRTVMNGDVPDLTKCEQIWDYLYSEDAAYALLNIGLNGMDGKTYVIGSGRCRPLKEYVNDVINAIDPRIQPIFGAKEYYPDQAVFLCADIGELTNDTGFRPRFDFKEGIGRTISWFGTHSSNIERRV